jgi:superfamily I DNA/RNA helicase
MRGCEPFWRPLVTVLRRRLMGTFHAIGNRFLREYAESIGLDPSFTVLDRSDSEDRLNLVRNELGLAKKDARFPRKQTCLAIYSHTVNACCALTDTLESAFPWCGMGTRIKGALPRLCRGEATGQRPRLR